MVNVICMLMDIGGMSMGGIAMGGIGGMTMAAQKRSVRSATAATARPVAALGEAGAREGL